MMGNSPASFAFARRSSNSVTVAGGAAIPICVASSLL
jgi:hypothetical protein